MLQAEPVDLLAHLWARRAHSPLLVAGRPDSRHQNAREPRALPGRRIFFRAAIRRIPSR